MTDNISKTKRTIQEQILLKNRPEVYHANFSYYDTRSDKDVFPYSKYFKGEVNSDEPIIDERIAGWTPRDTTVIKDVKTNSDILKKSICFQVPCSTVFPCYTQSNGYISSNAACLDIYR
jgi:hypothetical protein